MAKKKAKRRPVRRLPARKASGSHVMPGFQQGNISEVVPLLGDSQLGECDFPPTVNAALVAFSHDAMRFAFRDRESLKTLDREQRLDFGGMLSYATHMGFAMALYRYADQLQEVPELAEWKRKRHDGLDKGHATQTQAREAKYQRIRDTCSQLEAEGKPCTYDVLAVACGCSRSTVERAINSRTVKRTKR